MFKKPKKLIICLLLVACIGMVAVPVFAQSQFGLEYATALNLGTRDLRATAIQVVNILLGFLGIVLIGILLYGGYLYMMSGGAADKVEKAKKILINGAIGLAIILASYTIAFFIIHALTNATGGGGGCNNDTICDAGESCSSCPGDCGVCPPPPPLIGAGFAVSWVDPAGGEADVSLCRLIQMKFNRQINPETIDNNPASWGGSFAVNAATAKTDVNLWVEIDGKSAAGSPCAANNQCASGVCAATCQGDLVPGEITMWPGALGLTFNNTNDFEINATYKVTIKSDALTSTGLKNTSDAYLTLGNYTWTFTTGAITDTIPPQVVTVFPSSSSVDVCLTSPIEAAFNEPMDISSLLSADAGSPMNPDSTNSIYLKAPNVISGFNKSVSGSDTLIASPKEPFAEATQYFSVLDSDVIRDSCGNYLDGNENGVSEKSVGGDDYPPANIIESAFFNAETAGAADDFGGDNAPKNDAGNNVYASKYAAVFTNSNLIPINTAKHYTLSGKFKSAGTVNSQLYFGLVPYDKDQHEIDSWHVLRIGNDATIKNYNATTINVNEVINGWYQAGSMAYQRTLGFYYNGDTTKLPDYVYHWHTPACIYCTDANEGAYNGTTINGGSTINLNNPIPSGPPDLVASHIIPGITVVKNHYAGGTYMYSAAGNATVPAVWTEYKAPNITGEAFGNSGVIFRPGTKYVRILFLANYWQYAPTNAELYFDDILFAEVPGWSFTTGNTAICVPEITSVAPAAGYYNDESGSGSDKIIINGNYFTAAGNLILNNSVDISSSGTNSCILPIPGLNYIPNQDCLISWTDHEIQARVPAKDGASNGASTGNIAVEVGAGNLSNAKPITVASPRIDSIWPNEGGTDQFVTISGSGFGAVKGANGHVYFRRDEDGDTNIEVGAPAELVEANYPCAGSVGWTDEQIIISVPDNVNFNPGEDWYIQVVRDQTTNKYWGNLGNFKFKDIVPGPGICSVIPSEGVLDDTVQFSGVRFQDVNPPIEQEVNFGNYTSFEKAKNISSWAYGPPPNPDKVNADVPNLSEGKVGVYLKIDGKNSNTVNFIVHTANAGPKINYFERADGAVGEYVTIYGNGFGNWDGGIAKGGKSNVQFANGAGGWVNGDFDFPEKCGNNFWSDTQIVVKVPAGAATGNIKITTRGSLTDDTSDLSPSNFTITAGPAGPGICNITPKGGPVGSRVDIFGERFTGADKIIFFNNKDGLSFNLINDEKASAVVPNKTTPVATDDGVSGPIIIVDDKNTDGDYNDTGEKSNGYNFNVFDCREAAGGCADIGYSGYECCYTGSCMDPAAGGCNNPSKATYSWNFSTGTYATCGGYSIDQCMAANTCPNSPGLCSSSPAQTGVDTGSDCGTAYCNANFPVDCAGGCSFSNNSCVSITVTCDIAKDANLIVAGLSGVARCNNVSGNNYWQIDVPCQSGTYLDTNGRCTLGSVGTPKFCNPNCADSFDCIDLGGINGACVKSNICPSGSKCASDTYPDEQVSYWPLDEVAGSIAHDSNGTNNGNLAGGPIWTAGKIGGALSFNGTSDYVETGSNGFSTKIGTIAMWAKANSWGGTLWTNYRQDCGRIRLNTGASMSFFRTNSACGSANVLSAAVPSVGQWHHIAVSYDFDNDKYALYIDGAQANYSSLSYDDMGASASTMQIGCAKDFDWPGNNMGSFFNGLIDNVRIYKTALNPAQIKNIFEDSDGMDDCVRDVAGSCECCCRVDHSDTDCCTGLTCEDDACGTDDATYKYGHCRGCAVWDSGNFFQTLSDDKCGCTNNNRVCIANELLAAPAPHDIGSCGDCGNINSITFDSDGVDGVGGNNDKKHECQSHGSCCWNSLANSCYTCDALEVVEEFCPPSAMSSPSPQQDKTDACLNSIVYLKFNLEIDPATLAAGVEVYRCAAGGKSCTATAVVAGVSGLVGLNNELIFTPAANFIPDTWYKVIINKNLKDLNGLNLNNNYQWFFKMQNGTDLCAIDSINVTPKDAVITIAFDAKNYNALPIKDCTVLNPLSYNWNWQSSDTSIATITNVDTTPADGLVDPSQIATAQDKDGSTRIIASVPAESKQGEATLFVLLKDPKVKRHWPDCKEACLNAAMGAEFDMAMDPLTLIPANIKLNEWHCGNGEIEVGEDCDDGNTISGDGCSGIAITLPAVCNAIATQEECENKNIDCFWDGAACQDFSVAASKTQCQEANGYWNGVTCDNNKGCLNEGSNGSISICGNGTIESGEECDGNPLPQGCDVGTCLHTGSVAGISICGDSNIAEGEDCDDGNVANGDGCSNVCLNEGTNEFIDVPLGAISPSTGNTIIDINLPVGNYFDPNTYYRAFLSDGIRGNLNHKQLTELNWDFNKDNTNDSFSWSFKTKSDFCSPDTVKVAPAQKVIYNINATQDYEANVYGSPDSCNPIGQKLNPYSYNWSWFSTAPQVANFIAPFPANNWPGCGNEKIEVGEDCDDGNNLSGDGCSSICLNEGTTRDMGLVSHWEFNEGSDVFAHDSAGVNDGDLFNGPLWTTGKFGGALDFDGVDDYVAIDAPISSGSPFTISMWYYPKRINVSFDMLYSGTDNIDLQLFFQNGTNKLRTSVENVEKESSFQLTAGNINQWHHIVWVYDYIDSKVWVDGINVLDTPQITPFTKNDTFARIGQTLGGAYPIQGIIDDVRIYDKALTGAQVQGIMSQKNYLCGNGVVDFGEDCDGSPFPAGCNVNTCLHTGSLGVCGNGIIETGEDCDDSNAANGDGCSSTCLHEGTKPDPYTDFYQTAATKSPGTTNITASVNYCGDAPTATCGGALPACATGACKQTTGSGELEVVCGFSNDDSCSKGVCASGFCTNNPSIACAPANETVNCKLTAAAETTCDFAESSHTCSIAKWGGTCSTSGKLCYSASDCPTSEFCQPKTDCNYCKNNTSFECRAANNLPLGQGNSDCKLGVGYDSCCYSRPIIKSESPDPNFFNPLLNLRALNCNNNSTPSNNSDDYCLAFGAGAVCQTYTCQDTNSDHTPDTCSAYGKCFNSTTSAYASPNIYCLSNNDCPQDTFPSCNKSCADNSDCNDVVCGACRNAQINITFDKIMDPSSFNSDGVCSNNGSQSCSQDSNCSGGICLKNIRLGVKYDDAAINQKNCPSGYYAENDLVYQESKGFIAKLVFKIKTWFNKLLGRKETIAAEYWCAIPGTIASFNSNKRTTAVFTPQGLTDNLFEDGVTYRVTVKHDVKRIEGVSMGKDDSNDFQYEFKVGDTECNVETVDVYAGD